MRPVRKSEHLLRPSYRNVVAVGRRQSLSGITPDHCSELRLDVEVSRRGVEHFGDQIVAADDLVDGTLSSRVDLLSYVNWHGIVTIIGTLSSVKILGARRHDERLVVIDMSAYTVRFKE